MDTSVTFSDHKWITFEIVSNHEKVERFRNPRKTDWELYRTHLMGTVAGWENPQLTSSRAQIDKLCMNVSEAIVSAYEASCPLSNPPLQASFLAGMVSSQFLNGGLETFNEAYGSKGIGLPVEKQGEL